MFRMKLNPSSIESHNYIKIKESDIIIVGTSIWIGNISSVAQRVFERLEGTYSEGNKENGQYPIYSAPNGASCGAPNGATFSSGLTTP